MEIMIDIILMATTLAAVIFCFVLSKRLNAFKQSAANLGATIASLSETVAEARSTVVLAKENSAEGVEQLTPLVEEAQSLIPELNSLLDVLSDLAEVKLAEIDDASTSALKAIEHALLHHKATLADSNSIDDDPERVDRFSSPAAAPDQRSPSNLSPKAA